MKKDKQNSFLFFGMVLLSVLFFSTMQWVIKTFDSVSIEEIVFHMKVPLEGTNTSLITGYIKGPILSTVVITLAFYLLFNLITKKRIDNKVYKFRNYLAILAALTSLFLLVSKVGMIKYISNNVTKSTFIEEHYVDPLDVTITFPEQKRNLVYIVLESYEASYTDKEHGGIMDENLIGDLRDIALNNTSFSNTDSLGGPQTTVGSTWTIAGLVSQSSGLPLKLPINAESYGELSKFLPGMTNLGDILNSEGYNQMFLLGSDIRFASRDKFYAQHGNYVHIDYIEAMNKGMIYPGYWTWWGYEDEKLFQFAKERIVMMAENPEPFNFTILTADTHFAEGYKTEGMEERFETQYENVILHSSKQLTDFLEWMKLQDFYENTTVVIVGDHLTMDGGIAAKYFNNDYTRTLYNAIINSPTQAHQMRNRDFTSLDMFPTILSSLGVTIEGDRLGLGTDMYSQKETLSEQYGFDHINTELAKVSKFYTEKILVGDKTE